MSSDHDEVELVKVLRELQELIDGFEELGDAQLDPPPAWLPREAQEKLRAAVLLVKESGRMLPPAKRACLDARASRV
jgi:hypothetical protein